MNAKPFCAACENVGARYSVWSEGSFMTAMPIQMYWDEDGARHVHDPNVRTEAYRCSNGHRLSREHRSKCLADGCEL